MEWINDEVEINRVFNYCISHDSRKDSSKSVSELREKFVKQLKAPNTSNKEKLIRSCHLFDNSFGSYSRERYFEICLDEKLVDSVLLTDLYISVHSQAHPYAFFSSEKMTEIFETINKPFKCFFVKNELEDLPRTFMIYRGLKRRPDNLDLCGYCWSLKREVALKFATNDGKVSGYIVAGEVNKDDVVGLVLARDEFEIIAEPIRITE